MPDSTPQPPTVPPPAGPLQPAIPLIPTASPPADARPHRHNQRRRNQPLPDPKAIMAVTVPDTAPPYDDIAANPQPTRSLGYMGEDTPGRTGEISSALASATARRAAGQPATTRRATARPAADQSTPNRRATVRPAADQSTADRPAADRTPADRTAANGTTADHVSADGAQAGRTTADRTTADRTPAGRTTADRTTADHTPADRTTADRTPADRTTADHTPADRPAAGTVASQPATSRPSTNSGRPAAARPSPDRAAEAWPSQFAQVLAETLAGSRPPEQLTSWTTEQARQRIRQLGPLLATADRPRVRRVLVASPAAGVLEMTVIVGVGGRVRALAVRLERPDPAAPPSRRCYDRRRLVTPQWLCTAVEAA